MSDQQSPDSEQAPLVPPIGAGDLPPVEHVTSWPKTLGILGIIFGMLGILKAAIAIKGTPILVNELASKEAYKQFMASPIVEAWMRSNTIYGIGMGVLGAMLLVCGIGLLLRRKWAVRIVRAWAGLKILAEVVFDAFGYLVYMKVTQAISQGAVESDSVPGLFREWSLGGIVFSFALSCGLAIFVLIWLAREDIREETNRWR